MISLLRLEAEEVGTKKVGGAVACERGGVGVVA